MASVGNKTKYTGPVTYRVTTEHPTGYKNGTHEFTVKRNPVHDGIPESRYVTADGFGCSRDYVTPSDMVAIGNFLSEHGMRMVKFVKVK